MIHVIGIGAGDPDYVTAQAVRALNDTDVFFAMDKGEAKNDLVELRRDVCRRFIDEPRYRFVELPDPRRAPVAVDEGRRATTRGPSSIGMPNARGCGPTPSSPNSVPTVSEPSWLGVTPRCTTAPCGSSTRSPSTSN